LQSPQLDFELTVRREIVLHPYSEEEHIDVWYECLRQIGSEEMCRDEFKLRPAPFNTESMVRAYWKFEEVAWEPEAKKDLDIWNYQCTATELSAYTIEDLKRVCKVKTGKAPGTKQELITAIVNRQAEETLKGMVQEAAAELEAL
jgi:hypothetical protein